MGHSDLKTTANYYKKLDMKRVALELRELDNEEW